MKSIFQRIDYWLQSIFVVEKPAHIHKSIQAEEVMELYQQFRDDEKGLALSIRSLLEERLTGKVTDKDINYCIRWARELVLQDVKG
jgi:hypothetical protein